MTTETNVPAQASDEPMLPVPCGEIVFGELHVVPGYSADQMRAMFRAGQATPLATAIPQPDADLVKCPQGQTHTLHGMLKKAEQDAERYRLLRRKAAIINGKFVFLNMPLPTYVAPLAEVELDSVIDAAIAATKGAKQ